MADKSLSNELQRVLVRPDVEELIRELEGYREYMQEIIANEPERTEPYTGNPFEVQDPRDADRALANVILASSRYDDPHFLGVMAAGPLEDILRDPTPELLERIIAEARKTLRFRWMLSGVWSHAIAERAREPVHEAVGGWSLDDTPLPERPWS